MGLLWLGSYLVGCGFDPSHGCVVILNAHEDGADGGACDAHAVLALRVVPANNANGEEEQEQHHHQQVPVLSPTHSVW